MYSKGTVPCPRRSPTRSTIRSRGRSTLIADGAPSRLRVSTFVVFNPTGDDFRRNRRAMDGFVAGWKIPFARRARASRASTRCCRRHTARIFVVPPRRHSQFSARRAWSVGQAGSCRAVPARRARSCRIRRATEGHPSPHVDSFRNTPSARDVHRRRASGRTVAGVAAPVTPPAEDGEPPDVDVDPRGVRRYRRCSNASRIAFRVVWTPSISASRRSRSMSANAGTIRRPTSAAETGRGE